MLGLLYRRCSTCGKSTLINLILGVFLFFVGKALSGDGSLASKALKLLGAIIMIALLFLILRPQIRVLSVFHFMQSAQWKFLQFWQLALCPAAWQPGSAHWH